jgi:hypothetical protein
MADISALFFAPRDASKKILRFARSSIFFNLSDGICGRLQLAGSTPERLYTSGEAREIASKFDFYWLEK